MLQVLFGSGGGRGCGGGGGGGGGRGHQYPSRIHLWGIALALRIKRKALVSKKGLEADILRSGHKTV